MTIEIALGLLAAAIPLTALALKLCSNAVSPEQFVKLETEFRAFRREVRINLNTIKKNLEKRNVSDTKTNRDRNNNSL